jgi:hypothetical protein
MNKYRITVPISREQIVTDYGQMVAYVDAEDEDEAFDKAKDGLTYDEDENYNDNTDYGDYEYETQWDDIDVELEEEDIELEEVENNSSHHRGFGKECSYFLEEINQL